MTRFGACSGAASLFVLLALFGLSFSVADDVPKASPAPALPPVAEKNVDFATDIQPILAKSCFQCHGAGKQQAGLRLDRKADALAGGDSGKAFEPGQGKSGDSLLIRYVAGVDPDFVMPPKGERLSAAEIGLLRAWIEQGAKWPDATDQWAKQGSAHWSYQPLARPALPAVKNATWVRNPIDAFVLAKLEQLGVEPSPEADRATLIRRLSLDLLGLPPTPAAVEAFVKDQSPKAYETLVDSLLKSPHFGERWGRHWLDLARYADSDGYEKDNPRPYAWRYRDWVIDAVNRDLPFDQFTIEQFAGDLLPNATREQRIATGFQRNTLTNTEGGVDQEEYRIAAIVDRVNTVGSVWLGLTVGCAQCHSHKYDQFTQREYYQLFAFFNSANEANLPAPTPAEQEAHDRAQAAYSAEHAKLETALKEFEANELPTRQAEWEKSLALTSPAWTVLEPTKISTAAGTTFARQPDGSYLATGEAPLADTYTIEANTSLSGITALRLEVFPDDSLPAKGPGRVAHGNFVLSEFKAFAAPQANPTQTVPVTFQNPSVDFAEGNPKTNSNWQIASSLDGKADTGWAIAPKFGERHVAVFETTENLKHDSGIALSVILEQQYGARHTIGRFRLSATTAERPLKANPIPDDVLAILAVPLAERNDVQKAAIAKFHQAQDAEHAKRKAELAEHAKKAPSLAATTAQMLIQSPTPRQTHVLIRGDFLRKGDETAPGVPAVLHSIPQHAESGTRLDLARWLVDPSNPLTPRVVVNQWWQQLLGRGLVATVEDFGVRGEMPSHPELLDWLAGKLIAEKWSRKEMIRLIVNSATYRQASRTRADLTERDPRNVWLARQSRFRLEAEVVRDLYLTASGLLNPQVGGPSVRPPLPSGVAEIGYAGGIKWPESSGPDKYRRGMYIFFQRTVPYPMLNTFDAPDSNVSCVRRERSNTPLQALTLLNDPVFFECAQGLGRRMMKEHPQAAIDRIRFAFQTCLARQPTSEELLRLARLHDELVELARTNSDSAAQLVGKDAPATDQVQLAAAVALGRVILNLDEFMVRE